MSGTLEETHRTAAPPEHLVRRRVLVTLGVVLVVVGLLAGGPWVYARFFAPAAPPPLALPEEAPEAVMVVPGPLDLDGTWRVGENSEAGYRLAEVLSGEPVTVVGRTDQVTGTLTVEGGVLMTAEVVVDVAAVGTDESARDAYFRRALDTSTHPQAAFRLTAPVQVAALAEAEEGVPLQVPGVLVLHGVERPVTAELVARRAGVALEVVGTVPVLLADHGLTSPELGFVTVEPQGTVEVLLRLTR